ncbi:MAG: M6 family metalloprotease domain-containing protein [Endomicrobia bacterium]|nr:M6 family metalloprotease domain-containing protein [Endomicrobiia bacterium]MDW8055551.1 M6 family metalloprotease domain-containing protein [Elusimicrobiota bacterium]
MYLGRKEKVLLFVLLIFCFFSCQGHILSAPHISGRYLKGQPRDSVKVLPDVSHLIKKRAPAKDIAKTIGSVGTKKVAVIIVDFNDKKFTSGWYTTANQTFTQLKNYYNEVSYGQLKLEITFFYNGGTTAILTGQEVAYTMPKNMSYYAQNTEESLSQLVKDAIIKSGVNKQNYHCVMVLHAGYGAESTDLSNIWSVYVNWEKDAPAVNGFFDGTIVPEKELNASPLGVVCHEFGHQLGLPDLYYPAQDGNQYSIVGIWCLMDAGCWLGNPAGSQPAHLSAWCKKFLGWVEPMVVSTTTRNVQLPYVEVSPSVVKIEIITADDSTQEYFLLEYKRKLAFDSSLPGEGILIWRIDDRIAMDRNRLERNDINSGIPHLGVDLVEADMTKINNKNLGEPTDVFTSGMSFIPSDYNVWAYNGEPIPTFVMDIAIENQYAKFNILYQLEIKNLASGEVKIGNNYTYPGRIMVIGFNLPQDDEIEILVYNISGKLVKNFGKNFYPAGNNSVQWWTIDDNNERLSPGLYFVVVKGETIHKVEKFIIKK